jgi:hypothetical protein
MINAEEEGSGQMPRVRVIWVLPQGNTVIVRVVGMDQIEEAIRKYLVDEKTYAKH